MKIPRYWRQGKATSTEDTGAVTIACYGSSNESEEAAQRDADARARRAADAFSRDDPPSHYGYGDRPVREEIYRELEDGSAIITRNAYGSLILNTARVMFLDIDDADAPSGPGMIKRLFGRSAAPPTGIEMIRQRAAAFPRIGLRFYRTLCGYRGLVTNRCFDPLSSESEDLLCHFGCDPMFVSLCRIQECYRARLTAKAWRCGVSKPPPGFPFAKEADMHRYRAWEETYHDQADQHAACRFVEHIGPDETSPEIQPILTLHDDLACLEEADLA